MKSLTRGKNILDVFISNVPHYWKKVKVTNSLVRSDHKAINAYTKDSIKACRTYSYFRDNREHCKLSMFKELETVDWKKIMEYGQTPDMAKIRKLLSTYKSSDIVSQSSIHVSSF